MTRPRYRIDWSELSALEPQRDELERHVAALATGYNDPRNAPLLGHDAELTEAEVLAYYASMADRDARGFLLLEGDQLAGDGDLRGIAEGVAEFAFLIAAPAAQGKGLGTRFAIMIHAFAFGPLALDRVYASIVPANVASRRVFDKIGYAVDDAPIARAFADDPGDLVMSIDRATFVGQHARAMAEIQIGVR